MILNSKGQIYYGMHFYPGIAQYDEPGKEPLRVFLNEDTLRKMDPTFAGRPLFVEHVDEVTEKIDDLRKDADGWVIESFFNSADGKHWVKFISVTDKANRAIKNGLKLSNAYIPKKYSEGGLWNGVAYQSEIIDGEFEHLAIVKNPRYEESIILTPEQFKKYNEDKQIELKRLANSKGEKLMGLSFFKKQKVENSIDLESMAVTLPKSKIEKTITQLVNEADEHEEKMKANEADHKAMVKLHDGSMCNVGELLEKHKAMHDEIVELKKKKDDEIEHEEDLSVEETPVDVEGDKHNEEDEEAKKKALELAAHEEKEIEEAKKKNELEKRKNFDKLRNAHKIENQKIATVELSEDKVARGKARYGSN